jgi:hypothetical protein
VREIIDQHPELMGQQFGDLMRGAQAEAQAVGDDAVATWLQGWLDISTSTGSEWRSSRRKWAVYTSMTPFLTGWMPCWPRPTGPHAVLSSRGIRTCSHIRPICWR